MDKKVSAAMAYARTHLQAVRIVWIDREPEILSAADAVAMCSNRGMSGRIVGVVAQDKALEDVLNKLLDGE